MSGAEQRLLLQNLPGENTVGPLPRFLGEGPNGVSIKFLRLSATGRPPEDEGFSLSHALSQTHNTEYGGQCWHRHELRLAVFC